MYSGGAIAALHTTDEGLIATGYFSAGVPTHIACSDTETHSIAVSGSKLGSNEAVLSVYEINVEQLSINVKLQEVVLDTFITEIHGMAMGNNSLYITCNQNIIYEFKYPLFEGEIFYVGAGQMFKIELIPAKGEFIAANDSHILVGKPYTPRAVAED